MWRTLLASLPTSSSSGVEEVPVRAKIRLHLPLVVQIHLADQSWMDDNENSIDTANLDSILVMREGDFIDPDTITVKDVESRFDYSTN